MHHIRNTGETHASSRLARAGIYLKEVIIVSIEKLEEIRLSFFKDIDTQPIHKFYLIDVFMLECIDIFKEIKLKLAKKEGYL